ASGAAVVLTTSSPADARTLADRVLVLHRGLVSREVLGGAGLVLGEGIVLRAFVHAGQAGGHPEAASQAGGHPQTPGGAARALAAALVQRAEVRGVSFQETPGEATLITVHGDRAEDTALALTDAALAAEAEIEALIEEAPSLGEVRSATESLWRMMRAR